MKQKVIYLFAMLCFAQTMMAQITSLGLVEESNIANADKYEAMRFIPELSFAGDYLYVASPNGVFKTPYGDAEASSKWEKLPLTDNLVLDIEVRGDTLIALTRDQLIYSVDGGKTAKSFSATEIMGEDKTYTLDGMAVHPHNARQIIVTSVKGLMCTNDGGANWEAMDAEIPVPLTRLFYNPSNADQLVGIYNNYIFDSGALLFSHDGGQQWMYGDGVYHDSNISEIYNVAFHPTIEGKMAACGVGVYGLSEDGGVSWTGVFEPKWGQVVAHITDILYDTRNPNILYGADWGGMQKGITTIVRSTDGGYTWKTFYEASLAPNAHVLSLDMKDNLLALYTYGGGIYLLDVDEIEKPQTPKPYLVTEGKQWAVCTYSFRGDHWTNTYRLRGDTTINGKTYKIEHESQEPDLSDMRPSGRYMREENGKVYSITDKDKREKLFFDYTMQIGDTLRYNPNIDYYGNVSDSYQCIRLVAIRDTVMPNGDGKVRKTYHVQSGRYDEGVYRFDEGSDRHNIFIEDIGFVFDGLSHPTIDIVGGWSTLLYVKQDDTMLYQEKEGVVWSNSSSEEDKAPYLVKEGKKWHIRTEVPYVNKNTYDIFMWVEGDTIINGVSYKKLHKQTRNVLDSSMGTFEIGYCYQANNRYYQNGELMFDFSLQEGDVFYPRKGDPLTVRRTGKMALDDGIIRKYLLMVADTQDPDTTYNADYWIEGIGSLKTGILTNDFTNDGLIKELQSCIYNGEYIYKSKTNETKPVSRPTNRKGYGIYYDDSYLYRYTINEAEEVTDSTDFARWHDKTVIYFDVDSVGRDAFANACFRQGQILYFTEKLRYIGQDAFGDILMLDDKPEVKNPFGDLCIVFSGENPPSIDENSIVNYADTTYRITYVVPDLATYIENDMQWTYSQLVTIDDFIAGYISPENEVAVSDSARVDLEVGVIEDNTLTGVAALYVAASPKKDIPVRIGDGENKDIYSRAPAWMLYTIELVMTDSKGDTFYTDKQQCNAYDKCYFEVKLTTLPEDGIVCVYSRSIDQYGNASDWTMKKIHLMNIDSIAAPENHSPYYDMQGREVAHPTRGIYIKDGRKVVIE